MNWTLFMLIRDLVTNTTCVEKIHFDTKEHAEKALTEIKEEINELSLVTLTSTIIRTR